MSIAPLLTALRNQLGPDPIPPGNVRNAFDNLFGGSRAILNAQQPTQQEVHEFIGELKRAILAEGKPRSQERDRALTKVRLYNNQPGNVRFSGIDPHVFAFQLALRIREPSLIDQSDLGLCGANSVMIYFAKHSPEAFADYAVSLMKTGRGKFRDMQVEPALTTRIGHYAGKMAPADIVILGSLGIYLLDTVFGDGAIPGTVCNWLTKAGYANPKDKTFVLTTKLSGQSLLANLQEAATDVAAGRLVIIATDGDLQQCMHDGKLIAANTNATAIRKSGAVLQGGTKQGPIVAITPKTSLIRRSDHWTLVSRLAIVGPRVDIKLYSWQHSMQRSFVLDSFLSYYGGYIVAG